MVLTDDVISYREKWYQVKLQCKSNKVALWEWRRYKSAIEVAKLKVPDLILEGEQRLILAQLPGSLLK